MKSFETKTTIKAPASTAWALLTDAPGYPKWNSTVTSVEGKIAPNERIKVWAKISPKRAFPVTVTVFEPDKRMVWSNSLPLGLFTGERTYTLTPQGDGSLEFFMREVFSGPMGFLIERTIPDLQPDFEAFAASLKTAAEAAAAAK